MYIKNNIFLLFLIVCVIIVTEKWVHQTDKSRCEKIKAHAPLIQLSSKEQIKPDKVREIKDRLTGKPFISLGYCAYFPVFEVFRHYLRKLPGT